jgi:hypothetical protein
MKPLVTLRAAFEDPHLLQHVMGGESREPMRAILLASQGEELTDSELSHFKRLTDRETPPSARVKEAHIYAGRRAGKSSGCASIAVYASALCDYSDRLSPGERGVVLLIAENQRQAKVLLNYIAGAFDASAPLKRLITNRTQTSLSLSNGIDIEVRSADFRALRGLTLVAVIADEICFWRSDLSSNPDQEIIDAIRPGLITTRGQLFTIGSPYAKTGFGYRTYRRHFGEAGDPRILVAKGGTRDFNVTIPQEEIDRALEEDAAAAASEWLGEWRSDIAAFVDRAVVEACVAPGRHELPRQANARYVGFVDPSGGSSDSMTLCIAHKEGENVVIDCIRERRPPFSPDDCVREFAQVLKSYGVNRVVGDKYGGIWPTERFKAHSITYEASAEPKSDLYREMLPLLNAGRVELLDHQKTIAQLCALERRVGRSGKDSIDHPDRGHDDCVNAVAGALRLVSGQARHFNITDETLLAVGARPRRYG